MPTASRILEIGAGTGANFSFYPQSQNPIASEISFEMIRVARTKTDSVIMVQADAESLPFPANHFDAAFATLVFCSVADPAKAFAELRRVIRPRGRLVLLEHVRPDGILGYFADILSVLTVAVLGDHFNRQTARTVTDAGFTVIELHKRAFGIINLIVCELNESGSD